MSAAGAPKYAHLEREQRWRLNAVPPDYLRAEPVRIEDRYLRSTNLRVRTVTGPAGVVHKLGQKIRVDDDLSLGVWHTTMYLDEAGVRALDGVAGLPLTKLRHRVAGPPDSHTPDSGYAGTGGAVVVDVFEGELDGLILAEVELGEGVAMGDHPFATEYSRFITAETTRDERYGGGSLAEFGHPDRTPDAPSVMVVWHSDHGERGATRPLAEAAQRGVEAARAMLGGPLDLRVQIRRAIDVYAADLASTDLVVWVTPTNFGALPGGVKALFDRCYREWMRLGISLRCVLIAHGESDPSGAARQLEPMLVGLGWPLVRPPLLLTDPGADPAPAPADAAAIEELCAAATAEVCE